MIHEDILSTIAEAKYVEVRAQKRMFPHTVMEKAAFMQSYVPVSISAAVKATEGGIIAEHKRRSPSKGEIAPMSDVAETAIGYQQAGAAAMSVLTDTRFFGGSLSDLVTARSATSLPLLRKDFIIDEYQIFQARAYGADAILLIAAMLTPATVEELAAVAHSLGLEVVLELHTAEEIQAFPIGCADIVGINNRNLRSFETSLDASLRLFSLLPPGAVCIAESGIKTAGDAKMLLQAGFSGLLIGEAFMSTPSPGNTLKNFLNEIR